MNTTRPLTRTVQLVEASNEASSVFSSHNSEEETVIPALEQETKAMLRKKERLNITEAALYIGRNKQTLYNRINQGQGPRRHKRDNGQWEFEPADLDAYLKATTRTYEAFR